VTNPHAVPTDNAGGDHVAANVVATCEPLGHTAAAETGAPVTPPTATPPAVSPSTTQPMLTSDNTSAPDATATNVCATASEATPSPNEAARRLACFADEVIQNTRSPLLNTPPAQQAPTKKRAMPLCSSRIASQQLAHVPTSKRGEVLLMRKMGILQNTAPPSPGAKWAYDAILSGNLTTSQVAALDELFPATKTRAGRVVRWATVLAN